MVNFSVQLPPVFSSQNLQGSMGKKSKNLLSLRIILPRKGGMRVK